MNLKQSIFKAIRKGIYNALYETNRIKRYEPKDYPFIQDANVDFGALRDMDDEWNSDPKNKKYKINTQNALYSVPKDPRAIKTLKRVQDQVNDRVIKKLLDKYGSIDMRDKNVRNNILYPNLKTIFDKMLAGQSKDTPLKLGIHGKLFAYGNKKLPASTMIINLTSAFTCPSVRNHECKLAKICYAYRDENRYGNVLSRNLRNELTLTQLSIKDILLLLSAYIECAPARIKQIRLHEDGDFKDQETLNFCDKIAGHLYAKYGITTTAYTHRNLDFSNIKNMIINMSDKRQKGGERYYLAVSKETFDKLKDGGINRLPYGQHNLYYKCNCDCTKCNFCYQTKKQNNEPENEIVTVYTKIR